MTAQKGAAFLLKIGSGAAPVTYEAVAGLRTTQMSVNGDTVLGRDRSLYPPAGFSWDRMPSTRSATTHWPEPSTSTS